MTKQDLVNKIAGAAGVTKKAAGDALGAFIEAVTAELKKGGTVTVTGFGTFKVSKRAARTGVNPRNPSEKIKIPAMKLPTFKAGKALKAAVRQLALICNLKSLRFVGGFFLLCLNGQDNP